MRPETDVLNKKEAKRKKTAQPVRTDDGLLLARALYSWSESDRQAIEIPNHELIRLLGDAEPGDVILIEQVDRLTRRWLMKARSRSSR